MSLISREAAIDEIKNMYEAAEKWGREATDEVIKVRAESCMASLIEMKLRIEKLPSAQPERKKGKWIEIENEWGGLEIICSECGVQVPRDVWGNAIQSDYCYRCGADMRGEEDET